MKKNIHVSKNRDGKWKAQTENTVRAAGIFETQKEAIKFATDIAKSRQVELFIHGRDGKIRERNSFGNDPFPPKG